MFYGLPCTSGRPPRTSPRDLPEKYNFLPFVYIGQISVVTDLFGPLNTMLPTDKLSKVKNMPKIDIFCLCVFLAVNTKHLF